MIGCDVTPSIYYAPRLLRFAHVVLYHFVAVEEPLLPRVDLDPVALRRTGREVGAVRRGGEWARGSGGRRARRSERDDRRSALGVLRSRVDVLRRAASEHTSPLVRNGM